jgi:FAD/FMN-containing dehydrogenase
VKLGRKHRIPFLATGGRHGYGTTLGGLQNGLAIDLRQLNAVRVDRSARTVTVGGGTRLEEVLGPVNAAGFEMREFCNQPRYP